MCLPVFARGKKGKTYPGKQCLCIYTNEKAPDFRFCGIRRFLLIEAQPQTPHFNRRILLRLRTVSGASSLKSLRKNRHLLAKVSGCLFLGFLLS